MGKMVVKTETCVYTEYKIYPGRGIRFVAKDVKTHLFINSKATSMFHQRIKPVKLTWTQAWRRKNKKGKIDDVNKNKRAKAQKFQKAIVGMSLTDLAKKKGQKTELRVAAKEKADKAPVAKAGAVPKNRKSKAPAGAKNQKARK